MSVTNVMIPRVPVSGPGSAWVKGRGEGVKGKGSWMGKVLKGR